MVIEKALVIQLAGALRVRPTLQLPRTQDTDAILQLTLSIVKLWLLTLTKHYEMY